MIKNYVSNPVTIQAMQWFPGVVIPFEGLNLKESAFIDGTKGEYYGVHPDVFAEKYAEESP